LINEYVQYGPVVKHSAFSDEAEWRLVSIGEPPGAEIGIRATETALIPFIEIGLETAASPGNEHEWQREIGVDTVRIGPTMNPSLVKHAIKDLLFLHKLKQVRIEHSTAPYRTIF